MGAVAVAVLLLQLYNVVVVRDAWPYLAGLVAQLVIPFAQFMRLLRSILGTGR